MFVSRAKHSKLQILLMQKQFEVEALQQRLNRKIEEWNELVAKINKKGGQAFLDFGVRIDQMPPAQFDADELKLLLQLCHPDKHGGKDSATRMTQKLLSLR